MKVRWTTDAADDLERICDYIADDRPESARRIAQSVLDRVGALSSFPLLGRSGRVSGTRELAFPSLPFLAVYEVVETRDEVRVLRVLHGAQRWPPRRTP
jgi:addiction module RelE/StbE family toxin